MAGIFFLAIAYVISHFYRTFLAVLSPVLGAELGISPDQLSKALGIWFIAFALSQFLVGVMLDRYGPRWTTVLLFAVFGGGGGILFSQATSYETVLASMMFLGIGCAPILMASLYIFKQSFDARKFALLTSIFIAVGLCGNVLSSSPLAYAMDTFGWRGTLIVLSVVTVALSALIFFSIEDVRARPVEGGTHGSYLDVLKLKGLWFILPLVFMNYALGGGLRGLWAGPYLDIVHGLTANEIGVITFWMAIAMTIGSFAYGPLDQIFKTRKWVIAGGSTLTLFAIAYWALNPTLNPVGVTIVLVSIGMFGMCYGVVLAHSTANIPNHLAGRGLTLINFFNMGGVGVMQWVTAIVYEDNVSEEVPVAGFEAVLWVYTLMFGAALVIYYFSKDAPPSPATVDKP